MNRIQKLILLAGCLLAVVIVVIPPTSAEAVDRGQVVTVHLRTPMWDRHRMERIDVPATLLELGVLAAIGAAAFRAAKK